MKQIKGVHKDGVNIVVTSKTNDDSGFYLQEFFDNLYKEKGKSVVYDVLFADENATNTVSKSVLSEWKIVYDKREELYTTWSKGKDARSTVPMCFVLMTNCVISQLTLFLPPVQKKQDTATDEGGPSCQFLTDIFKQIDKMSVKVGSEDVSLFENTPSGVMVGIDDKLWHPL